MRNDLYRLAVALIRMAAHQTREISEMHSGFGFDDRRSRRIEATDQPNLEPTRSASAEEPLVTNLTLAVVKTEKQCRQ